MNTPQGAACTDAERRHAVALHDALRARGHEAWVETVWVRPQDHWSRGLHALLAVIASLVATAEPIAAAAIAGITLLSLLVEATGRPGLRALFYRRATQLVVVEPRHPEAIALHVVARTDRPRRGTVAHRARAALERHIVPAPGAWLMLCVAAILGAAVARIAGVDGDTLGPAQFIPTTVALLMAAAALDTAAGPLEQDPDPALQHALDLHDELTRHPPRHFSPALIAAGAHPHALRTYLRREQPDPAAAVILELRGTGAGRSATLITTHPQLRQAAAAAQIAARRWRTPSRRVPSGVLEAPDALDEALLLVDALDDQLAER